MLEQSSGLQDMHFIQPVASLARKSLHMPAVDVGCAHEDIAHSYLCSGMLEGAPCVCGLLTAASMADTSKGWRTVCTPGSLDKHPACSGDSFPWLSLLCEVKNSSCFWPLLPSAAAPQLSPILLALLSPLRLQAWTGWFLDGRRTVCCATKSETVSCRRGRCGGWRRRALSSRASRRMRRWNTTEWRVAGAATTRCVQGRIRRPDTTSSASPARIVSSPAAARSSAGLSVHYLHCMHGVGQANLEHASCLP